MPRARVPRFGLFGTVGPAPRFTWGEARCRDGWLPDLPGLRMNIVRTAVLLNALRVEVARVHGIRAADVFIHVTSWTRSDSYNATLPGAAPDSYHTQRKSHWKPRRGFMRWPKLGGAWRRWRYYTGKGCAAADIVVVIRKGGQLRRLTPQAVAAIAERVPAYRNGGVGVYPPARGNFTHVDHRGYRSRW